MSHGGLARAALALLVLLACSATALAAFQQDRPDDPRYQAVDDAGNLGAARSVELAGATSRSPAWRSAGSCCSAPRSWWPAGPCAAGRTSYSFIATYFVSRYSSMPTLPPSRPKPDCFTPPNGAPALDTRPWLRPIMPVSSASQTRNARLRSEV